MKPPPFEYVRASSLEEAVGILAGEEDAHVLAGGQSLMPLLALRLARPSVLVDLGALGLDTIEELTPQAASPAGADGGPAGSLRIGAMVRQRRLELDPCIAAACPLLADAARQVGYPATRNLGTLGGSLAHADPTAELPAVAVALGGQLTAVGPNGARRLACTELGDGFFTTTLARDEVITEVELPLGRPPHGGAWCEWAPRAHDFAESGVGVAVELGADGECVRVHAAACAVGGRPLELGASIAAAGLLGATSVSSVAITAVARAVQRVVATIDEERAELTGLLAGRAALLAFERASTHTLEMST